MTRQATNITAIPRPIIVVTSVLNITIHIIINQIVPSKAAQNNITAIASRMASVITHSIPNIFVSLISLPPSVVFIHIIFCVGAITAAKALSKFPGLLPSTVIISMSATPFQLCHRVGLPVCPGCRHFACRQ